MRLKTPLRYLLSLILLTTGVLHFIHAPNFARIMPPQIPFPLFVVYFTGMCELAAAVGLQVPTSLDHGNTRRLTALLLTVFFVAIFPANLYMALHPIETLGPGPFLGLSSQTATLLRLPLQLPLIAWAWWYTAKPGPSTGSSTV